MNLNLQYISVCVLFIVFFSLLFLIIIFGNDISISEHEKKADNDLDYSCGGTTNERRNCLMINKKLDLILEKLP